ncbi:MAG: PSD1 and planctomycete cytochrome C domain-containing protein [Mariniblastus sp.]|nr:PSD1 and planctomycete cytochrome C domain-containing protein [Mariniblastus sp.]MDG2181815.1 PSD1 and planctomycete cytochrome C domain-containing protein [Mariniblastus sp.]
MARLRLQILIAVVLLGSCGVANSFGREDDVFLDRVVPIFQARCLECHRAGLSKGDFSLEDADSFFEGDYIERGDSANSHFVELISSQDSHRAEMPKNGSPLTDDQIKVIRSWIDSGASWPDGFKLNYDAKVARPLDYDWWSFREVVKPVVPVLIDSPNRDWIRNPIDAFVLEMLERKNLAPSKEANRRTLIRRLSYDLTGLPPTIAEVEAYEEDKSEDAYERVVERLLASPRYGERWARHWLDVVKYADTCGYDKDKLRPNAWPYRDYVIRSFNDDKPYRQFVQEQIAGDVLFPGTEDGILGLGFIAAGPWDFIGHVEVPESKLDGRVARNLDRDDMVSNTFNSFCSLTVQCARCHDHKFDPITQDHYYRLQAIFAAVDRADRVYAVDPKVEVERTVLRNKISKSEKSLAKLNDQLDRAGGQALVKLRERIAAVKNETKKPEFGYHSKVESRQDTLKWVEIEFDQPQSTKQIVLHAAHDEFNNIGAGFGFPLRFRVEVNGSTVFNRENADFPNPGLTPIVIPVAEPLTSVRLVATKLAQRSSDYHLALAEIELLNSRGENVAATGKVTALDSIEAPVRWGKSNLVDGIWYESSGETRKELQVKLDAMVLSLIGPSGVEQKSSFKNQIAESRKALSQLPAGKAVYAAATDFKSQGNFKATQGQPRPVYFLPRGEVASPGPRLEPGIIPLSAGRTIGVELKSGESESVARSKLALWLTDKGNPLLWRSVVNRIWHYHFGRGIVDTPNDFGRMGGERSHPELLDWLAATFRDGSESVSAESFKDLHRLIVTSSVYRQSSSYSGNGMTADSGNRYLWRMNRRRLSAEEIRDSILHASGLLNLEMGGAGYFLFQLEKTEHSPHYEYHKFDHTDPKSYRRSIYRFIVRSQPDPFMTTLDCADSSQSTPARNETQTPLQSLTMLNSDFSLEMSKRFARRIELESADQSERIQKVVQESLGRSPTELELSTMGEFVQQHGLANLIRIVFNLSEFVFID